MTISVTSGALRVELDPDRGAITAVRHLTRGLELIAGPPADLPFRLELDGIGPLERIRDFVWEQRPSGLRLSWSMDHGITLVSDVVVRGEDVLLTIEAINGGLATIDRIEYPIVGGIGRLGGRGEDELAHTHATGMLFHDPLDLLEPDPENHRKLRYSPYPEGFAGATMQFMAYYARGQGGFLLGTEDAGLSLKWLNVFKDRDALSMSVIHKAAAPAPGVDLVPSYPVVIAPLFQGTWYEAGDRYRSWAIGQPWARPAPRSRWLREDVGITTFGVNARHDRSPWLDEIHRMAGTPVFHVLGPNWAATGQDYENHLPRGMADWFPAVFDPSNLETIRRNGDYWAPFEFDLLCADPGDAGEGEPVLASRLRLDAVEAGRSDGGLPNFPFMCPGTAYWHDLHVARDERLVVDHDPDALYYDISVNNVLLQCLADGHDHRPGSGEAIGQAFATMYADTNAATARAKGGRVPAGAEMISECFIEAFDFYQARGEAGPYAPFETAAFRDWVIAGRAEKIPLFTYVFGERAPLRMDGWGKLSAESGDLLYWTAATVVLNGGLFQINGEFSGLEDLASHADDPGQHYYPFEARRHGVDPAKAAFIGEVARARTGPANPYLAHGSMVPAPRVEAPRVALPYFAYNMAKVERLYETRGEMAVDSALATAWQLDGRVMWLVANLLPEAQEVLVDDKRVALGAREIQFVEP